jgi:hypothetical protein
MLLVIASYYAIISEVWKENEFLVKTYSTTSSQLQRIQKNVRAGSTLQGFCPAGREERFE